MPAMSTELSRRIDVCMSVYKGMLTHLPVEVDTATGRKKPYLFIHRGLPGSFKTTFANAHGCLVISPGDQYSYRCGQYKFDEARRPEARRFGDQLLSLALFERVDVAVAEVLPSLKSVRWYEERAAYDGYNVLVFDHINTIEESFARNAHGVPLEVVKSMAAAWEPYPGAIEVLI